MRAGRGEVMSARAKQNKKVKSELYLQSPYCVSSNNANVYRGCDKWAHSNSIDFDVAMNCTNIYSSLTHTHSTQQRSIEVFAIIWSGVIKHERLKRTDFKWQLCIIYCVYCLCCAMLGACVFILLRRVKFKPNELQSALNLHFALCMIASELYTRSHARTAHARKQAWTLSFSRWGQMVLCYSDAYYTATLILILNPGEWSINRVMC